MKILSLFDGISCGRIALERAGVPVEEYHAFEVDKYAIQVSEKNYPDIMHHGDVFKGNFKDFSGFDMLIGGSPCTYWSIAQSPDKRETTASGFGWELFSQYVRALKEAKPDYFIYENNYSMADEIRKSITETFGFEPVMIDSALFSGQSRKRLYWVGKKNQNGEYERCVVPEPKDKGILLEDILESGTAWQKKSYCLTASYHPSFKQNMEKNRNTMVAEPIAGMKEIPINPINGKSHTICATYGKIGENPFSPRGSERSKQRIAVPVRVGEIGKGGQGQRIYSVHGKSVTLAANGGGQGAKTGLYKIDLPDGDYVIRKLTPVEAERLQTLPDNYTEGISNTQRYKCIGNGWTVDVIAYLMQCALSGETEPLFEQLSLF